jgi:hypothetical protein
VFNVPNVAKARNLQFVPLTQRLVQACEEFNERLRRAGFKGSHFNCSANRDHGDDPPTPMENESYVGVDADGQVRGGYHLKWQFLWLRGQRLLGASWGYPISEGIIDKQYAMVGVSVLRDAVKRCEYLYVLGAGGRSGDVFRIAQHAGWAIEDVPFLFRVIKGGPFLRKLPQTRHGPGCRLLATISSATGLAQIGVAVLHASSAACNRGTSSLRSLSKVTVEEVASLAGAANEVWSRVNSQYAFCVVRDDAHVEPSFPVDRTDLRRLVIRHQGSIIGWSVVMRERLSRLHAYLGDVAPGLIVDAFGDTAYASEIVRATTAYLAAQGVDVVITNTSHSRWLAAYKGAGFLTWQSQFPLIVSQSLAHRIGHLHVVMPQTHMSRGDGDGVHYLY